MDNEEFLSKMEEEVKMIQNEDNRIKKVFKDW